MAESGHYTLIKNVTFFSNIQLVFLIVGAFSHYMHVLIPLISRLLHLCAAIAAFHALSLTSLMLSPQPKVALHTQQLFTPWHWRHWHLRAVARAHVYIFFISGI
jgi:hypothetical protein